MGAAPLSKKVKHKAQSVSDTVMCSNRDPTEAKTSRARNYFFPAVLSRERLFMILLPQDNTAFIHVITGSFISINKT